MRVHSLGGAFQNLTPAAMATDVPPQNSNLQEGGMPSIWNSGCSVLSHLSPFPILYSISLPCVSLSLPPYPLSYSSPLFYIPLFLSLHLSPTPLCYISFPISLSALCYHSMSYSFLSLTQISLVISVLSVLLQTSLICPSQSPSPHLSFSPSYDLCGCQLNKSSVQLTTSGSLFPPRSTS